MRIRLQSFGGVFKITLRGRQVATSRFEVASNDLITRCGGERFECGDGWSDLARLSLENQNADAFAQNRGARNAAIGLAHACERLVQKNGKGLELFEFGLRIGGEHGLAHADLKV